MEDKIDDELSYKEIGLNQLEALMSAVPFVGSAINTLYFGHKRDREFKRVKKLYELISLKIDKIESQIKNDLSNNDPDAMTGIMELIHESAQKDYTEDKLEYLRNCYYNSMISQNSESYDSRKVFIRILNELTEDDIGILSGLYKLESNQGFNLDSFETEQQHIAYASFERLKSYGLAHLTLNGTIVPNVDLTKISLCKISDYGRMFYHYCLTFPDS